MKNQVLIILLLVMAAYPFHSVFGAPKDSDVRFTVHNLSNNLNQADGLTDTQRQFFARTAGADQVCIFCHTPHNATPSVPLWNKAYDASIASTYRLYTSSKSLSTTVRNSSITATSESMLCLSCHDGKTAVNVLHNTRVREATVNGDGIIDLGIGFGADQPQSMGDLAFVGGVFPSNLGATRDAEGKIDDPYNGTNLTDDHPIGFSYQSVLGEAGKSSALRTLADAKANKLRFFGPSGDRVECSSCHNPHVYYGYGLNGGARVLLSDVGGPTATEAQLARTPFLVRDNNGSALCLGCHIK